jgi:hypothetical protein
LDGANNPTGITRLLPKKFPKFIFRRPARADPLV